MPYEYNNYDNFPQQGGGYQQFDAYGNPIPPQGQPMGPDGYGPTGMNGFPNQGYPNQGFPNQGPDQYQMNQGIQRTGFPDINQPIPQDFNQGYGQAPMPPQQKKSKAGLIVGIIVGAVLISGIIAAALIFLLGSKPKGGYDSPEAVIRVFFEAYSELDEDKMKTCFPSNAANVDSTLKTNMALAQVKHDTLDLHTDQLTCDVTEMTETELGTFKKSTNMRNMKKGYNVYTEIPFDQQVMGVDVKAVDCYDIQIAQVGDKYFLVNMKEVDIKVDGQSTGAGNTQPDTTTPPDTTESSGTGGQGRGHLADASGLSSDPLSLEFLLEGKKYTLPCAFTEFTDAGWTYDEEDYKEDDDYLVEPGKDTLCVFRLQNSKYENFYMYVGFFNDSSEQKPVTECVVTKVSLDASWGDSYPEVILPGGVTWGSNRNDVESVYGKPSEEPYYSESLNYYSYDYSDSSYTNNVELSIYDDGGVSEIAIRHYN